MSSSFHLRVALETFKNNLKITVILSLIFMGIATMYAGIYPTFEGTLEEFKDMPINFIRGYESLTSYPGFLNMELYQVFWTLILAILIGYVSASLISEEIESKTIDMLMSNPISRKRIVFEKYLGLIPLILLVNFATLGTVFGMSILIHEKINFFYLSMTHLVSILYFLAVASIGLLISTIIDKKMKASIVVMAIIIGMYMFESMSLIVPNYSELGLISLIHYYDPAEILLNGNLDLLGIFIMLTVTTSCLLGAMLHFERRDIAIS